jgi:sialic acid synthase SpsE
MKSKYGFATDVLWVFRDVKAGETLTMDNIAIKDFVGCDGLRDRLIHCEDASKVIGRKLRVDLKTHSVLLWTDIQ